MFSYKSTFNNGKRTFGTQSDDNEVQFISYRKPTGGQPWNPAQGLTFHEPGHFKWVPPRTVVDLTALDDEEEESLEEEIIRRNEKEMDEYFQRAIEPRVTTTAIRKGPGFMDIYADVDFVVHDSDDEEEEVSDPEPPLISQDTDMNWEPEEGDWEPPATQEERDPLSKAELEIADFLYEMMESNATGDFELFDDL